MHKPIVTTDFVLMRMLQAFAQKLGVAPDFASLLVQLHVKQSPIVTRWGEFIFNNCSRCVTGPETCEFLHPTSAPPGRGVDDVLAGRAHTVEAGTTQICPLLRE